jgi:DNA-binding NtrC family response regulator
VRAFGNPQQALDAIGRAAEAPDLLLTDVVLPGMNGRALYEQLHRRHPGLRVLYMSGYPGAVLDEQGIDHAEIAFIHKPFAVDTLLARVGAVLDG